MSFQPLGYRTPLDTITDYERTTRARHDRDAVHRLALLRRRRGT